MIVDPKIVWLKELLTWPLCIPPYQRPYTWSVKAASTLFHDVVDACENSIQEYRMGSVILYKNGEQLEIVDGQQRLTTLSILFYCLDNNFVNGLLSQEYGRASKPAMSQNFVILSQLCGNLTEDKRKKLMDYIQEHCSLVVITAPSEQSAFQFFDSQNSRGKELAPHDLLKSYHLREMNDDSVETKTQIINTWENSNQKQLAALFENSLYPLVQWHRRLNGLGYSSKDINTFKGIQRNSGFNFSVYHKAANLYIEQANQSNVYELLSDRKICQFQLTQPIIAGKRFFAYTLHYLELNKQIDEKIAFKYPELSNGGRGDWLVRNLFVNAVMFFVDRFGMNCLNDSVFCTLFSWVYVLRISLYSVYEESVNKYARGEHSINYALNIFYEISMMNNPNELFSIALARPDKTKATPSEKKSYQNRIKSYFDLWDKYSGVEA